MNQTKEATVTYVVHLSVTRPVRPGDWGDDSAEVTIAAMVDRPEKRRLEKDIVQALKKIDGDCDCEVLETVVDRDA